MGRPYSYIRTTEVEDRAVILRQCPVTCGRPTKMSEGAFRKVCAHHQKNEYVAYGDKKRQRGTPGWCSVCAGKQRPAELEIISVEALCNDINDEVSAMPSKTKHGTCKSCGAKGVNVGVNYGGEKCSSCNTVYSNVNRRLETVVAAIKHLGLAEKVIAALGGVMGFPVEEVVSQCGSSDRFKALSAALGWSVASWEELISGIMGLRNKSAQLDAITTALVTREYPVFNLPSDIAHLVATVERLQGELVRVRSEHAALAEQASEAEQRYLASEQVFAGLREVLGADGARNEELPQVVRERISGVVFGMDRSTVRPTALDSHLLDLLVEFPAIGVERIAVLREAA